MDSHWHRSTATLLARGCHNDKTTVMKNPMLYSLAFPGLCLCQFAGVASGGPDEPGVPKRLRRADSFLGIHFDFHAGPDCTEIGRNTTTGLVERIIDLVHPDYLQIDCKGHPGLSSYPTRVGNPAPGFVGDPLRTWRSVTARRGIALYMHYSGVMDAQAIARHPDWAVIDDNGKTNANVTSLFSPYADQLLIPQLRELANEYAVDGAWIDGECWAAVVDYSAPAAKAFRTATGIENLPRKPTDPHWIEFLTFHREAFRQYLRHYVAEIKRTNPAMQLCSNWAFSDHMPEPVSVPLDFLSGDYSPEDSINSARFSARCLARQGKPWDLMAWSFVHSKSTKQQVQKSAVQLQREAAVVLALGGGFQAYFTQKRDGSVREEQMPVMAEVARFCRDRQSVCHRATQVPQVAILYSTESHYRQSARLFAPWSADVNGLKGTLQALLAGQNSVEVLSEHHLAGHMADYPLIVVPEWEYLQPTFRSELATYARGGGSLLLVGPATAALFKQELGTEFDANPAASVRHHLVYKDGSEDLTGPMRRVRLSSAAQQFGNLSAEPANQYDPSPAASIQPFGLGQIAAVYFSLGQSYLTAHGPLHRQLLKELTLRLFPKPMVAVEGSPDVDVVVNRLNGKLAINVVNTAGNHRTEPIFDSIPTIGPLTVTIRQPARPTKITLMPEGRNLDFDYAAGEARLVLHSMQIHAVLVVE